MGRVYRSYLKILDIEKPRLPKVSIVAVTVLMVGTKIATMFILVYQVVTLRLGQECGYWYPLLNQITWSLAMLMVELQGFVMMVVINRIAAGS